MTKPEPEDLPFLRDYKSCGVQLFIIDTLKRAWEAEKSAFLECLF